MTARDRANRGCLTEGDLRGYHARELDPEQQQLFRVHIEKCAACATRAGKMLTEHDTWIERVRHVGAPPVNASSPSDIVEQLGAGDIAGYQVCDEISRGGQGVVYRAKQDSTGREVAVKVLREGLHASPAARRRFEREIELAAELRHPNDMHPGVGRPPGRVIAKNFLPFMGPNLRLPNVNVLKPRSNIVKDVSTM